MSPAAFLSYVEEARRIDLLDALPGVSVPTLVVVDRSWFGNDDVIRPLATRIPGARLLSTDGYAQEVTSFLGGGPHPRATPALPSGTAVILFADIVDSTALTERMGDTAFRERARQLDERLRAAIRAASGTPVEGKLLGDGVLAVFTSARQAIDAALSCAASGGEFGLQLHLGIHAGDVIREGDNVYGGAVNIASRISGLSAPDELLVSATVRDLARTSVGVTFEDRGEHTLKGVAEPVRVYAVFSPTPLAGERPGA